ncbi:MAG: autoinducer-2 kinase, partial [Candidatus Bathyarchaeia archaeon]
KDYLVSLDAGTGSFRCVIFNQEGSQISFASREWTHKSIPQYPGSQVFDTERNWDLIRSCIREALGKAEIKPGEVAAVSSSSMREGMVLYDEDGREIWACPNVDARAGEEAGEMMREGLAEKIYRVGGDWLSIISPPRFRWIRRHQPKIYDRIAHMTMLSDWINYKLTGIFATDPSIGSSSGLFDLSKRTWSDEIIELCGIPREIFPQVYESGTLIGEVTEKAARETGLKEGTPVILGGADTQMGLLGLGMVKPLDMATIGGTFWQQTAVTDKPVIDPEIRLRTLCHVIQGEWMIEGIGFYCGLTMRWFRDAFCELEKKEAGEKEVDPYSLMEEKAMEVPPGSNGVIAIFSNIMNAKRWVHASPMLIQFDINSPYTSGRKECIRAIQESAAYVSYGHLEIIKELLAHEPREIIFAGGASKGFLWPQILSDVFRLKIRVPVVKESTSLGTAIYAMAGVGIYRSIDEGIRNVVKWERTFLPNNENHDLYMKLYEKWRKVYQGTLELTETMQLKPMWSPPTP